MKNNIYSKQEMIDQLVESVNDWDIDTLINYVQHNMRENYQYDSEEDVERDWEENCLDENGVPVYV